MPSPAKTPTNGLSTPSCGRPRPTSRPRTGGDAETRQQTGADPRRHYGTCRDGKDFRDQCGKVGESREPEAGGNRSYDRGQTDQQVQPHRLMRQEGEQANQQRQAEFRST
jgi:hypothetical protein